jgi:alkaline phosphatase
MATGVKTTNGSLALDPDGNILTTILERAQARGMAVGLVTTVQIGHATPAAFASHWPDRGPMTEIVRQMLAHRVDVMLGGGEDDFLPPSERGCYPGAGNRDDGRNLIAEAMSAGTTYVCTSAALSAVDPASTTRLLGLFADGSMARPFSPSLADMTQKAISVLARDADGFFLMVEGGQIDWACHDHDTAEAISDTLGLDEAVSVAQAYGSAHPGTLIIVSGDHETGGMTVSLAAGGSGPFSMPDGARFYVRWTTTGHTGAEVPTTAVGSWASLLAGTQENTRIYDAMAKTIGARTWLPLIGRLMDEGR